MRTMSAIGVAVATALALTACGGDDKDSGNDDKASQEQTDQPDQGGQQGASPDVEDVPDVVAEVNGEEVSKDDFVVTYEMQYQQAAMQAQMSGEEPDEDELKKQTAESMVDTELLRQEAESRDIAASDEDVDAELADLAEQNGVGSVDAFLKALEEQGTSEDVVRHEVTNQVTVQQLVEDEIGAVEPSNKELRALYKQAVKQQKQAGNQGGQQQQIPPFAEVKPQLVEQATAEKQNEAAQTLVKQLREDADITINL